MTDLDGRVVVITGGNGGIGLGMAHGVAAAGAAVAVWGRDEAKNDAAVEALRAAGAVAGSVDVDVADEAAV
ncbi:MAG TPA: SDR family NAD(P)-dependent oxidoreductase, partial [Microthrixaceae bacterium]|nr:SDR family NAD(P)-dependent oxidoreductase [Microthrixaceae bacterium]